MLMLLRCLRWRPEQASSEQASSEQASSKQAG
jgi:hypothetical protein